MAHNSMEASINDFATSPGARKFMRGLRSSFQAAEATVDAMYLRPVDEDFPAQKPVPEKADAAAAEALTEGSVAATPAPTRKPAPVAPTVASAKTASSQRPWVLKVNKWLDAHPLTPQQIILRDKCTFMLGLVNVMFSAYLFGRSPRAFVRYFQIKAIVLLGSRWFVYRLKDWHFYLAEFCYACIGIGIFHTAFLPLNPSLYKLTYALFAGVLMPAIIATHNAFVLHSVDKITSLFQHLQPALVAWALRWRPEETVPGWRSLTDAQRADMRSAGFVQLTLAPMGVWLLWAVVYYIGVFVVADEKVRSRGYATMFTLQTKNPKARTTKWIFSFKGRRVQYAAYLCLHGAGCFTGLLFNNLWWHAWSANTFAVLLVLGVSLANGAHYYFDVFARKYMLLLNQANNTRDQAVMVAPSPPPALAVPSKEE